MFFLDHAFWLLFFQNYDLLIDFDVFLYFLDDLLGPTGPGPTAHGPWAHGPWAHGPRSRTVIWLLFGCYAAVIWLLSGC